jgi:hypothetical protein
MLVSGESAISLLDLCLGGINLNTKNFMRHKRFQWLKILNDIEANIADVPQGRDPEKNPDNPEAVNEFIQITKAYTIMTDEKARSNFEKFGNPDGQGSFAVGIALPTFI